MVLAFIIMVVLAVGLYFGGIYIKTPYLKAFFPMNDSVFESLKLIIFPGFIYMIIDLFIIRRNVNGAFSSYISVILIAIVFKICTYYIIEGIIGYVLSFVEYIINAISISIIIFYRNKKITLLNNISSVIVLIIIMIIITVFSYFPSNLNIFN
jgi:hypothetical protein